MYIAHLQLVLQVILQEPLYVVIELVLMQE
jgi:hypothetical protein